MAYENALQRISLPMAVSESLNQYHFVKINTSGQADVSGNGAQADGVLQDNPATSGFAGEIGIAGVSKVKVGAGGVTAGCEVTSDDTGQGVVATSGQHINAIALAAGNSGDIVAMLLKLGTAK